MVNVIRMLRLDFLNVASIANEVCVTVIAKNIELLDFIVHLRCQPYCATAPCQRLIVASEVYQSHLRFKSAIAIAIKFRELFHEFNSLGSASMFPVAG